MIYVKRVIGWVILIVVVVIVYVLVVNQGSPREAGEAGRSTLGWLFDIVRGLTGR